MAIEYDVPKKLGLTNTELNDLLSKWQEKLKMSDWKISISIVNFNREDFKQSGDFEVETDKKIARLLLTAEPWRGDEEYTLVHELVHILLHDLDSYSESVISGKYGKDSPEYNEYMSRLEATAHKFTEIQLGRVSN